MDQVHFSPGVLSLLPLFYVGWSDSVLSPSEVKLIHKKINQLKLLKSWDLKTKKQKESLKIIYNNKLRF